MRIEDMKSTHLFFSIRMVYNHSVPAALQIPGCKRYEIDWPASMRKKALKLLVTELAKRDPRSLSPWMWDQLRHMARCIADFAILKLPQAQAENCGAADVPTTQDDGWEKAS